MTLSISVLSLCNLQPTPSRSRWTSTGSVTVARCDDVAQCNDGGHDAARHGSRGTAALAR